MDYLGSPNTEHLIRCAKKSSHFFTHKIILSSKNSEFILPLFILKKLVIFGKFGYSCDFTVTQYGPNSSGSAPSAFLNCFENFFELGQPPPTTVCYAKYFSTVGEDLTTLSPMHTEKLTSECVIGVICDLCTICYLTRGHFFDFWTCHNTVDGLPITTLFLNCYGHGGDIQRYTETGWYVHLIYQEKKKSESQRKGILPHLEF